MKKIDKATIAFNIEYIDDDLIVLFPSGILTGTYDNEIGVFIEDLTKRKHINTNQASNLGLTEGFNYILTLNDLQEKYKTKTIEEAILKYWNEIKEYFYFYDKAESKQIQITSKDEFEKGYGLKVSELDLYNIEKEKIVNAIASKATQEEIMDLIGASNVPKEDIEQKVLREFLLETPISSYINEVKKSIISQDEAIKKIFTSIYKSIVFGLKSNILLYGPTGVGKTEIVRTLGKMFDLPVHIEDLSQYTDAGYKGSNPIDALENLYFAANKDLDLAERSILVLDELDKKSSKESDEKEFNKADVLKGFLKIIEGGKFNIELPNHNVIVFDSSKLIIIAMGAFSELTDKNLETKKIIGFGEEKVKNNQIQTITTLDFVKYGIPIEFLGRFNLIIKTNTLSLDDLIKILKESKLSLLNSYVTNFEKIGIKTNITDEAIEKIAKKALDLKTGARALNSIVVETFDKILYEVFDNPNEVESIDISGDHEYTMKKRIDV